MACIVCALSAAPGEDIYAKLPHGKMFRNVKDFGAQGDGISDDTEAFIRALDYGVGIDGEKQHGTVYIPQEHIASRTR